MKYFLIEILGIVLYMLAALELIEERGGLYIGGEVLLVFLPLWVWLISRGISELFEEADKK